MAVSENDLLVGPVVPANGVTLISVDFFVEDQDWLEVYKSGSDTPLTLGVDYTFSGEGTDTGSVTLTVAADGVDSYSVYLVQPAERSSDLQFRGDLQSPVLNIELDRLWRAIQGGKTTIGRTLQVTRTSSVPGALNSETALSRAGKLLGFDGSGDLEAYSISNTLEVVAGAIVYELKTVADLEADVGAGYSGATVTVAAGDLVRAGGFTYQVAASGASDHNITNSNSVKFYVLPGDEGYNIRAFGAVGDGVANDTAAIQAALDAASLEPKRVFAPDGSYAVANLNPANSTVFVGQSKFGTKLLVNTNGAAAFSYSFTSGIISRQNLKFKNFTVTTTAGITGARAFRQTDKDKYTAYTTFENIETLKELEVSYDGFYIFTTWSYCRDGYSGTSPGAQTHQGINSNPAAFGQTPQTNLNQVNYCQFFNASNTDGAVDISYGDNWLFIGTDFEGGSTRAARIRGLFKTRFIGCWFEALGGAEVISLAESPAPNPQGARANVFEGCTFVLNAANTKVFSVSGASNYSTLNCSFSTVPVGTVLGSISPAVSEACVVLSGDANLLLRAFATRSQAFISDAGVTSATHNVATTIKNMAGGGANAAYMVSASVSGQSPANYQEVALARVNAGTEQVNITTLAAAALLSVGASGTNVTVTQTSGVTQNITWSITRLS